MTMVENSMEHQLDRAFESSDIGELWELHKSPYMNVRRAVAKNCNIDSKIAKNLLFDPVFNVSYIASLHPNCDCKREFNEKNITLCVKCEKDERELECVDCENRFGSSLN